MPLIIIRDSKQRDLTFTNSIGKIYPISSLADRRTNYLRDRVAIVRHLMWDIGQKTMRSKSRLAVTERARRAILTGKLCVFDGKNVKYGRRDDLSPGIPARCTLALARLLPSFCAARARTWKTPTFN